jgi:hypothetical protein
MVRTCTTTPRATRYEGGWGPGADGKPRRPTVRTWYVSDPNLLRSWVALGKRPLLTPHLVRGHDLEGSTESERSIEMRLTCFRTGAPDCSRWQVSMRLNATRTQNGGEGRRKCVKASRRHEMFYEAVVVSRGLVMASRVARSCSEISTSSNRNRMSHSSSGEPSSFSHGRNR